MQGSNFCQKYQFYTSSQNKGLEVIQQNLLDHNTQPHFYTWR